MSRAKEITWKIDEKTNCWNCTSHSGRRQEKHESYPRVKKGKRSFNISRIFWEKEHGEIPEGMLVCHKCDNPRCINIEHFFLGTKMDNAKDCVNKGRSLMSGKKGEENNNRKLTEDQVREIKFLPNLGFKPRDIAEEYKVTPENIYYILNGKTWSHIK